MKDRGLYKHEAFVSQSIDAASAVDYSVRTTFIPSEELHVRVTVNPWISESHGYRGGPRVPDDLLQHAKRQMVSKLADALMARCEMFLVDNGFSRDLTYEMEVTINDRGTYEHLVPDAIERGKRDGLKRGFEAAIATVPYGVTPGEFYE